MNFSEALNVAIKDKSKITTDSWRLGECFFMGEDGQLKHNFYGIPATANAKQLNEWARLTNYRVMDFSPKHPSLMAKASEWIGTILPKPAPDNRKRWW